VASWTVAATYLNLLAAECLLGSVQVLVGDDQTKSRVGGGRHLSVESGDSGERSGLVGDGSGNRTAGVEVARLEAAPDPFVCGEFVESDGDGGRE
jgi:hypothetical protein